MQDNKQAKQNDLQKVDAQDATQSGWVKPTLSRLHIKSALGGKNSTTSDGQSKNGS